MKRDHTVWKFTPNSSENIAEIIDHIPAHIKQRLSKINRPEFREKYQIEEVLHKIRSGDMDDKNLSFIARSLSELGLIGSETLRDIFPGHKLAIPLPTPISREILIQYSKQKHGLNHEMQAIPNNSTMTLAQDFFENKGVHHNLKNALLTDLAPLMGQEFLKTYEVEIIGGPGGDHWVSVNCLKESNGDMKVEIFDSSYSGVVNKAGRLAAEAQYNHGLNNGISVAQVRINATVSMVAKELGLQFSPENFFYNSESMQAEFSLCSYFAHENAKDFALKLENTARHNSANNPALSFREAMLNAARDHFEMIKSTYLYDGKLGGKTEIDYEAVPLVGEVPQELLNMPAEYLRTAHGVSKLRGRYANDLEQEIHVRKDGSVESQKDRIDRYITTEEVEGEMRDRNRMLSQTALRQMMHVFEIIANPAFAHGFESEIVDAPNTSPISPQVITEEEKQITKAFQAGVLKRPPAQGNLLVAREEEKYAIETRLGNATLAELQTNLEKFEDVKVEVKSSNLSDLGFDLIGNCDHDATRINQVSVTMPYHIDILNSIHPEGAKDREAVGVTK